MAVFLLNCALRSPGRDYEPLFRTLHDANAIPALESSWLIETERSVADLSRTLLGHLGQEDGLFVLEIRKESRWAATRLDERAGQWLKARCP